MHILYIFLRRCRRLLFLWAGFLLLLTGLAALELQAARADGEEHLNEEARRIARRSGEILALPAWRMDEVAARSIVMTEMEDERIYGMAVYDLQGLLEGQRRDEQWESVPWDDLVPDAMAEGIYPLQMEGRPVGSVRVYLSPRRLEEHLSALWRREALRVLILSLAATVIAAWVAVRRVREASPRPRAADDPNAAAGETPAGISDSPATERGVPRGRTTSRKNVQAAVPEILPGLAVGDAVRRLGGQTDTYMLLTDLFRRLYAGAPKLLLRLAAREERDSLARLLPPLREAASRLGASRLEASASRLEDAVRARPEAVARCAEECADALEETLASARELRQTAGDCAGESLL